MQTRYLTCTYAELRKFNSDYQTQDVQKLYGIDINSFTENPYTYVKCKYFLELSTLIVFFLRKTAVKPNFISLLTAGSAIIGGLLILSPNSFLLVLGLLFFSNGYVFDWCDGLLARVTGSSSFRGSILDPWSSHFFALTFKVFLGLYVAARTDPLFFYFVPFVVFFSAVDLKTYFQSTIFTGLIEKTIKIKDEINVELSEKNADKLGGEKFFWGDYRRYIVFLSTVLDDRSRSIDLICLLILAEHYFNLKIVWVVFILMVLKELSRFAFNMFFLLRSAWWENKFE